MADFGMKNGHRLAVLRPADPDLAMRLTEKWQASGGGQEEFDAILTAQDYMFVGLIGARDGEILNENGEVIDHVQHGDSLVSYDGLDKCTPVKRN